jgi:four helix bundle protein
MDSYRSLYAWKQAHQALILALEATDSAWHPRAKALFDQINRAVVSVEANIVEGYALNTVPLFRRHLRIAFGSAAEAETLIRAAAERRYLSNPKDILMALGEAMRAIHGLMRRPLVSASRPSPD